MINLVNVSFRDNIVHLSRISKETHLKVVRIADCLAVIEFHPVSVRPSSLAVLLAVAVIQAFYESRSEFATRKNHVE